MKINPTLKKVLNFLKTIFNDFNRMCVKSNWHSTREMRPLQVYIQKIKYSLYKLLAPASKSLINHTLAKFAPIMYVESKYIHKKKSVENKFLLGPENPQKQFFTKLMATTALIKF